MECDTYSCLLATPKPSPSVLPLWRYSPFGTNGSEPSLSFSLSSRGKRKRSESALGLERLTTPPRLQEKEVCREKMRTKFQNSTCQCFMLDADFYCEGSIGKQIAWIDPSPLAAQFNVLDERITSSS